MFTAEQKRLVQATFHRIKPVSAATAQLFYNRLFQLNPAVRRLFTGDLEDQRRKLLICLNTLVEGLDRFDEIMPAMELVAARHKTYGARPEHLEVFGEALMWTLQRALGPHWSPQVQEAWAAAYESLAKAMQRAMQGLVMAAGHSPSSKS